jgi:hypothetical protein
MSNEIRIYVADLTAYNAGYLHGVWIDGQYPWQATWRTLRQILLVREFDQVVRQLQILL